MPFIVQPSDQVVIGGETTKDDFLCVGLENGDKIYVRNSTGQYQHLTLDWDFLPSPITPLLRKAALGWIRHRPRHQDDALQSAFEARVNKSQRLREFVASALLETAYVIGSESSEHQQAWRVQDHSFNVGRFLTVVLGQDLDFPDIGVSIQGDNRLERFELILPSPITSIRPISRWDVEIQWALRNR